MRKNKKQVEVQKEISPEEKLGILKKKTIKDLIAPAGIDASNTDRLEIISNTKRYARSSTYV